VLEEEGGAKQFEALYDQRPTGLAGYLTIAAYRIQSYEQPYGVRFIFLGYRLTQRLGQ
jgi:hypothetical protein